MESKTVCSNTCRIEETHKSCQGRTVICFLSHLFVWPEILCWRINTVEYLCKYTQLTMWNTFPNIHGNVYEWKNYAEISQCFAPQSTYLLIPFPINFLRDLYIFQPRFKCKFLCLLHYQSQWMGISCSSSDAQMPYQSAWNMSQLCLWFWPLLIHALRASRCWLKYFCLPSVWETWIEFPIPDFGLVQLQLSQAFGERTSAWKSTSLLSPFHFVCS